uniref:Gag-pol polyprotein n=1 Tax=Ascaris lumbricoides TaxID=6252 RepID=A0A0M3HLZ0_ASCLU
MFSRVNGGYKLKHVQDLEEQEKMTDEQLAIKNVGKQDPKRHLGETVNEMLADNIVQNLASMLDTASFQ